MLILRQDLSGKRIRDEAEVQALPNGDLGVRDHSRNGKFPVFPGLAPAVRAVWDLDPVSHRPFQPHGFQGSL